MTYLTIFSLEGKDKICCHSSVFLIRPTPTHYNSLGVDLKISIFWLAHRNYGKNHNRLKKVLKQAGVVQDVNPVK